MIQSPQSKKRKSLINKKKSSKKIGKKVLTTLPQKKSENSNMPKNRSTTLCISFIPIIVLISCMDTTKPDRTAFQELHNHKGSEHYEVTTIFEKEYEIIELYMDTVAKQINAAGKTNPIDKKETKGGRRKVSNLGEVLDEGPGSNLLKDGTIKFYNIYYNWVFNGDKTEHIFQNPFTEAEENDPKKWLERFDELYHESTFIYRHSSDYYLKIDGVFYLAETFKKAQILNMDIKSKYPVKENQEDRFMEFVDLYPGPYTSSTKKEDRDRSLIAFKGYEQTDSEKSPGINPISFSAGNYYLELYMPLGDTIKIKRHGSMGVNMQLYKIPVTQGGRNDVIFIVQEPNELYPDREFGGMYVVRPRSLEQEQYGKHESSADSYMDQYDTINGNTDTVGKFLWPMSD